MKCFATPNRGAHLHAALGVVSYLGLWLQSKLPVCCELRIAEAVAHNPDMISCIDMVESYIGEQTISVPLARFQVHLWRYLGDGVGVDAEQFDKMPDRERVVRA